MQDGGDLPKLVPFPISVDRLPSAGFLFGGNDTNRTIDLTDGPSIAKLKARKEQSVPLFTFSKPTPISLSRLRSGESQKSVDFSTDKAPVRKANAVIATGKQFCSTTEPSSSQKQIVFAAKTSTFHAEYSVLYAES